MRYSCPIITIKRSKKDYCSFRLCWWHYSDVTYFFAEGESWWEQGLCGIQLEPGKLFLGIFTIFRQYYCDYTRLISRAWLLLSSDGENVPLKTLSNGWALAEMADWPLTRGGGRPAGGAGVFIHPLVSLRQPQLARNSISVWMAGGIIVLRVSEAVITLTLWELWLCWPVHLARGWGALEWFQQQQVNMKNQIKGGLPELFVKSCSCRPGTTTREVLIGYGSRTLRDTTHWWWFIKSMNKEK